MKTAITVLTRNDDKPAGKFIKLAKDGTPRKRVASHTGVYTAHPRVITGETPAQILDNFSTTLAALQEHQCIILGHATNAGMSEYRIIPADKLDANDPRPTGLRMIDGIPTCARLKENFTPSRIQLLDYDPHHKMPTAWRGWSESERWQQFTGAVPEFEGAARLVVPSSSGRVLLPDGSPAFGKDGGMHTYVVMPDMDTDALDLLRTRLEVRLWASGLGYTKQSKSGATLKRTLFDTAVFSNSREVFDAPPRLGPGLTLAPLNASVHHGTEARLLPEPDAQESKRFTEATGARLVQRKASSNPGSPATASVERVCIESYDLRLGTVIDTEKGRMTVRKFIESGHEKLRCQATFRESTSWNGILRRLNSGLAVLFDNGTGVLHKISSDADDVPASLPDALAALERAPACNAHALASACLIRHFWRVPLQMSADALVSNMANRNAGIERKALASLAEWLERKARHAATDAVTIDPRALPERVDYRRVSSACAALAAIRERGDHVAIVRGRHASGKTQHILRPLALDHHAVIGIAPRVSLVADLAKRLKLDSYHDRAAPFSQSLALCINSITNERLANAVDEPDVVLVDEAARIIKETHSPFSTMKKAARSVWDKLCTVINQSRLTVLADADFSTADVLMVTDSVPRRRIVVYEIEAGAIDKSATIGAADDVNVALDAALASDDLPVLVQADSATLVASEAARINLMYPHLKVLAVHQADGIATAGSKAAKALLEDIDKACQQYDVLLLSPTVESGVSLNVAHFKRHFALYSGCVEPSAFVQMLHRDRCAANWHIGIMGHGFQSRPESFAAALNGLAANQRLVINETGSNAAVTPATAYDRDCCRVLSRSASQRNRYACGLWHQLEARGWNVQRGACVPGARDRAKDIKKVRSDALSDAKTGAILTAPDRAADDVKRLKEKQRITPEESAMVARYDVRKATGHGHDCGDVRPEQVEHWQDGRLESQARNFEALGTDPDRAERDARDIDADVPVALRSYETARAAGLRALFDALGLDSETGAGEMTETGALEAFNRLKGTDEAAALASAGICHFERTPAYPMRWVSDALKKLGLWLTSQGKRRRYSIAQGESRTATGKLKALGWDAMKAICDARRSGRTSAYNIYRDGICDLPSATSFAIMGGVA